MPRFIHTADWQIGRQFGRFAEEDSALLAEARFAAIETLAALAKAEQVDAVLVAGDVFDAQTVSDKTIHRVFHCMAGFDGYWIMIPGNHDAALAESVWTRAKRLRAIPEKVIALTEPEPALFESLGFAILPAPLTQRQTHHDLTAWFDHAHTAESLLRIGLAHGSVEGQLPESADSPNPIAPNRAGTARLDYLALGDWHGAKRVNARTWYSGTPEQERFKDNGAGQALLVDIARPGQEPVVEPLVVGQHQWIQLTQDLSVASDLDQMLSRLEALPPQSVVHLTITGQLSLKAHQELRRALNALAARHRCFQYDLAALRLQPTEEDIAELRADGYVGEVIQTLRDRQTQGGYDSAAAGRALAILADLLSEHTPAESPL